MGGGNPEIGPKGAEQNIESLGEAAAERQAELLSKNPEQAGERLSEGAEREKVESLFSAEQSAGEKRSGNIDGDGQPARKPLPKLHSKRDRDASYKKTMRQVQSELSPAERTFSKLIHNKAVEKTSDTVGKTIARPNALLAGSFSAFVLVSVVYAVSRTIGYQLSGFETIAAFVAGWVLGLLYDYLRIMIRGRSS